MVGKDKTDEKNEDSKAESADDDVVGVFGFGKEEDKTESVSEKISENKKSAENNGSDAKTEKFITPTSSSKDKDKDDDTLALKNDKSESKSDNKSKSNTNSSNKYKNSSNKDLDSSKDSSDKKNSSSNNSGDETDSESNNDSVAAKKEPTSSKKVSTKKKTKTVIPPPKKEDKRKDYESTLAKSSQTLKEKTAEKAAIGSKLVQSDPLHKDAKSLKMKAKKVRRVIRHIDPWSVLTFSVLFHIVVFTALILALAIIFIVGDALGIIDSLEETLAGLFALQSFEFNVGSMLLSLILLGVVLTILGTISVVILTVLFNLISDLTGGIRATVVEENYEE